MEDYCDRIPGQHTGRLSLEHQAREAAEWQRKVDDLQKQLDSANRIIQIKDETIILHEKRCDNLREELDELSDRVAVLHERIIEQNNAIRNSVKTSPAAGESSPISPEVPQAHGLTTPATPFSLAVDRDGTELVSGQCVRVHFSDGVREGVVVKPLLENPTLHKPGCWVDISIEGRGPEGIPSYILEVIDAPATPSAAVGAEQPELPKFPAGVEFCSAMEGQAKAWESIWEWCCKNGLNIDSFPSLNGPQLIASWILELKKSAAVGASEPVAGDHKEWCDGAKEFCERQVESDTVPRAEYDRVLTLNHHLREVAVMAITERVPSDSKPTNCINPESEDTPPRGNDAPATGKPFQLEHGKQYLRRDGKVSGVMTQTKGGEYSVSHPLWDAFHCLSYRPDGRYNVSEAEDKFDLISEYHEPEPSPPAELHPVDRLRRELDAAVEHHSHYTSKIDKALGQPRHGGDLLTEHLREIERLKALSEAVSPPAESPDVSGEIRGLQYALEWIAAKRAGNPKLKAAAWEMLNDMQTAYEAAVARLQDGESINSTSQTDVPAESPDDWVMITDPKHDARQCDECRYQKVIHRKKIQYDWAPCCGLIGCRIGDYPDWEFRCRRKDLPVVPHMESTYSSTTAPQTCRRTVHPMCAAMASAADKPRMRQVTLREFSLGERSQTVWGELPAFGCVAATGRMFDVEVPE